MVLLSSHCTMILVIALVVASSLSVAFSHGDVHGGPSFSYDPMSFNGPQNWGKLSPAYKACGEGKAQSPINIVTANAIPNPSLDNLTRVYTPADAILNNDGKDITMTFEDHDGNAVLPGTIHITTPEGTIKEFRFKVIHWHSPSEHTINGQRFPLEVHLVHASEDGHRAVVGILYKIGDHDAFYDQFEGKLRELQKAPHVAAGLVQLKSLQKRTGSYFRYMGSLTTPPCTENVNWNILGKVREISAEQLQLLTAPLPHKDNRPPQPLNGRPVQFYNPPNSTVSFQNI
ncbi:unnamed protein product [Alopecurus aequalis]